MNPYLDERVDEVAALLGWVHRALSSAAAHSLGRPGVSPSREESPLGGARAMVEGTEAEAREMERNRVAWNLPRGAKIAPSQPEREAPKESGESGSSMETATEHG
jgi:hypothetical protein